MEHDQLSIILLLKPDFVKLLSYAGWPGVDVIVDMGVVLDLR